MPMEGYAGELKYLTSDTLVKTGRGVLWGIYGTSNGTASLKIRDGLDVTGAIRAEFDYSNIEAGKPFALPFPKGILFDTGIFADISGQPISLLYE